MKWFWQTDKEYTEVQERASILKKEFVDIWVRSHSAFSSEELETYIDWAIDIEDSIKEIEPDWDSRCLFEELEKTGLPLSRSHRRGAIWVYGAIWVHQWQRVTEREDMKSKRHKALRKSRSSML